MERRVAAGVRHLPDDLLVDPAGGLLFDKLIERVRGGSG